MASRQHRHQQQQEAVAANADAGCTSRTKSCRTRGYFLLTLRTTPYAQAAATNAYCLCCDMRLPFQGGSAIRASLSTIVTSCELRGLGRVWGFDEASWLLLCAGRGRVDERKRSRTAMRCHLIRYNSGGAL